ncbi:PSD1 and planctomycete cytochrome C domain-containing protein [Verrucomicrobia bacterium]|nr:PSD1 and planctomycete cytochrome C domain-containing protein [Verrucomicrobiota bacterium]
MKHLKPFSIRALVLLLMTTSSWAEDFEHFEKKIRPLFTEHCLACHSSEKSKGGLALDSKKGLLKGGDSGPAIVPGKPSLSLLVKAVSHSRTKLKMPKEAEKLSTAQIADLTSWIAKGAPDPRTQTTALSPIEKIQEAGKQHWAFTAPVETSLPSVKNTKWIQNKMDYFILSHLEEKGLSPAPKADKQTLLRRLSIDLTGLPPSQKELNRFLADKSKNAFSKMVDHYLASDAYGERWGRHWLDVARYGDSKGYLAGGSERRFPFSYTYRDYVIKAFNDDLPFDRFIVEQLAADKLDLGEDKRPLAGLGFLSLGRRFLGNKYEIIDDRIDVVTRGLQGLTVACARCHDHKYDPVPTLDYYSLYGIFSSTVEPKDLPLLGIQPAKELHSVFLVELAKREKDMAEFRSKELIKQRKEVRSRTGDYLLMAHDSEAIKDRGRQIKEVQKRKLNVGVVLNWLNATKAVEKNPHPVLSVWTDLDHHPEGQFKAHFEKTLTQWESAKRTPPINLLLLKNIKKNKPDSLEALAKILNELFVDIDKKWEDAIKVDTEARSLSDPAEEGLRQVLYGKASPATVPANLENSLLASVRQKIRNLQAKIDNLGATHEGAPPRAMSLADSPKPADARVLIRGSAGNPGITAPRRFLEILSTGERPKYTNGSGRLELAKDITNRNNPLTARVWANRIWQHHFGEGIVRTPSNFGLQSDSPSHPELLDNLAIWFMEGGWSTKDMHRLILNSATWQQASSVPDEQLAHGNTKDPANFLLWHMKRHRLELEPMRDSILFISGKLDRKMGGHPIALEKEPFSNRRTVYGLIERQNLPGLFRTFDFANPETSNAKRFTTSVPQQSLFFMNSKFMLEQATSLSEHPLIKEASSPAEQVRALFKQTFLRPSTVAETAKGVAYLSQGETKNEIDPLNPWSYGYGKAAEDGSKVTSFTLLPVLRSNLWQGGAKFPDPKLEYLSLNESGGHPGKENDRMAIRRWTAPADGTIKVDALLKHASKNGNGIRGRIISSVRGLLRSLNCKNNEGINLWVKPTEVTKGETIDFVVDAQGDANSDSFTWAPFIQYHSSPTPLPKNKFSARGDFKLTEDQDPPPSRLITLAQALLMSNEFMFVD